MTAVPFTAGPWKAERKHVLAGPFTYKPHWRGVESSAQMEANAKAIAALPALVEALVGLLKTHAGGGVKGQCCSKADAAIDALKLAGIEL